MLEICQRVKYGGDEDSNEWKPRVDEDGYPEANGSCGVAGLVSLEGKASQALTKDGLRAVANMPFRTGVTYNDYGEVIAADGAGGLLVYDKEQMAQMLTERQRKRLNGDLHRLQVGMFEFRRDDSEIVLQETRRAIERCFEREGLTPLGWRDVPTNENGMCEDRLPQLPKYQQLFFMTEGVDRVADSRALYIAGRRINADIRNVVRRSLALDRIAYSGLITPEELAGVNGAQAYFTDLLELMAVAIITHGRFATNVLAANPQPTDMLGHNGEINTIAANRKALLDLGRALGFFNKLLTNGGSDSIHLTDALGLMLANGVTLAEAMLRLMPPALKKVLHAEMEDFIKASKRAMGTLGMWEGPAAVLATDGRDFSVRLDRLGLRMMNWLKYKNGQAGRVIGFSSEAGAFEPSFSDIQDIGRFEAGGGMNIDLRTGEVVGGNALFDKILRETGLNWRQLSRSKLIVPEGVPDPADKAQETPICTNEVLNDKDLKVRLAAFGWKHRHVDSAVTRLSNAKPIISSLGSHTPVGVLDPRLANSGDLYKASAAIVTNPPFDAQGEPDVVEHDVRLGSMPQISARKPSYQPIHPQFELPSPLLSTRMLESMRKPAKNKAKVKTIDIGFGGGDYESFSARIAQIIEEVVHEASLDQSHRSSVIVLSDKNVFDNGTERLAIPPVFLVQRIHTALINKGLRRNISLVVESGGIRHAHDSGVLIANGCDAVCPYLLEAIAMKGKDPQQAMKNFFVGESAAFGKVLMKLGITTAIGATGGYWVSGIGLAPEVVNQGGAKINSKVGGMDMRLVFETLVKSQAERYADADEWMSNTKEKDEKAEGAYETELRELFNLVAYPDIKDLKKKLSAEECPKLYDDGIKFSDEDLSDIAFAAACKRREGKNLTLRDNLRVKYKYGDEEITPDMMKNAPSLEQIFKHIFQSHMSLGAQGPAAHAAMVRGCKRVGVQSANGEGGEEPERSRDGSRPMDRSESRQMGTAGWGVDLQYLMEADELCIKIAQGAKPGEGGDLPEKKVNKFVAEMRHVKIGTRLISPPPNHDIYSIEDLKGRIRALRALNLRARISIKLASMPGLGSIAEGIVKAGADVIEVSGFDASTGAADELSIENNGWMVENGLSEAHQYLVSSGVRDRIQLRGDGKMMTPLDFVKTLGLGGDGIGLGTLLMIFCKCIACKSCHTDKCPIGITTQDWERIVKFFVKGERPEGFAEQNFASILEYLIDKGAGGVERGLQAFGRAIQREIVKLGFNKNNWEDMIGNVDMLEQRETGRPAVDSMDLETPLLRKVKPPKWKNPKAIRYGIKGAVRSVYENPLGNMIIDQAEPFLDGQMNTLMLEYNVNNRDREFAVGLAGQIYKRMRRKKILTPEHRITLKSRGWGGHNYGFAVSDGMTLEHTGFMNDSCGQAMSGTAKIVIKCPQELDVEKKVLLGNQACMWATGGTLHCGGIAGARLGVRNSGATIVAEGALDYPFEYMTAGLGILLGDYIGEIGSRMTGGKLFLYNSDKSKELKYAKDYVAPKHLSLKDLDLLKHQLEAFYKDTGSEAAGRILENWATEQGNFMAMVPKADLDKGDDDE
ncbi:hypothetical protein HZA40_04125 [Candidatus Peregrinibacteria bacterium]|nr:hypothetical protein [Candidatus Peregrinibacteria bacterium]